LGIDGFPARQRPTILAGVIDSVTNFAVHRGMISDRIECVVETMGDPGGTDRGFDASFSNGALIARARLSPAWPLEPVPSPTLRRFMLR